MIEPIVDTAALNEIEKLVDERDFSTAKERLDALRSAVRTVKGNSQWTSRYLYLQARVSYNLGEYRRALIKIRSALFFARRVTDDSLYAAEKLTYGLICAALGRREHATEAYLEAYVFRKRSGATPGLYGPLLNIGLLHLLSGELVHSTESLSKAILCAHKYNSDSEVRLCSQALAVALWLKGDFKQLRGLFAPVGSSQPEDMNVVRLASVAGRLEICLMDYAAASRVLCSCLSRFKSRSSNRDVAVCLEYLGLNEYFAGNYRKAKEYYQQVLDMPEPTASAVAQTLRMMTDVHIAEGQWDLARKTAAKADAAITKISERIELGALWRAYGHIHAHDGNRDEARAFFTKSIELLRQLGARYELALSHFDAGRSTVFTAAERMEHLRTARALFVDMDVPKRVVQVDAALRQLEADCHSGESRNPAKSSLTLKSPAAPTIVAASEAMMRIMALADRVKDSDLTILITGETGTGKDLLAEYIHKTSNRAAKPWRVINSAAMPESLLEAELFGFTKGTYSGATTDRPGLIELTDGGTFVFDEIGEIPSAIQVKLLRLLDSKVVRRLGGSEDRKIDVRFLALTNRDLGQMVREGSFRSDLYHRLCQMPIHLPPLRERTEDIVPLAIMLLTRCGISIDREAVAAALRDQLEAYPWPGNARELIAMITRVAALLDSNGNSDVVELLRQQLGAPDAEGSERRRLFEALRRHNGNKRKVAEELGLPRTTLNSQLKKYNL